MHGGAPRVRRRRNRGRQTGASIEVNPSEIATIVVSSAIGAVVGQAALKMAGMDESS